MSEEKLANILIQSLDDKELYTVAKLYLKEIEDVTNIITCNGPWDSGIDMSNTSFEYQIQATVEEKNFHSKLLKDLVKAKNNITKYGLTNKVKYFYSHPLSNTTRLKYKKEAKDDYNIILEIIDSNIISDVASEYEEISKLLFDFSKLDSFQGESKYFDNVKVKAYYDLMSFGNSTDIKYNIIKSYTLNFLFKNDEVEKSMLLDQINNYFESKVDSSYFTSILNRLLSERKIKSNKETGKIYLLEKEKNRIEKVLSEFQIEENILINSVVTILTRYNIQNNIDLVIKQLSELYENTYSINLSEFTNKESNINDVKTATVNLKELLKKISNNNLKETEIDELIKELIQVADSSEILPRIAAGEVYSKMSDPARFERYVSQNLGNKTLFLDANVILYLLLAHYEPKSDYNNNFYKIANQFNQFIRNEKFTLKTINRYSLEVASIFKDAMALVPFTKLKAFKSLGESNNIIYKFYKHLEEEEILDERITDFEIFLKEFKFAHNLKEDDNYKSQMEYLLSSLDITLEQIKKYDYNRTAEIIRTELVQNNKKKSSFAVLNDAIMFERLGDVDVDVNPVDPMFCSWDISLLSTRKSYFQHFPGCTKWYMFTPTRLMDHISMMNFKVKPGMVSNEILSILDQDNSFQQMTHNLLDSVASVININNQVGLKYTNMLAEIREKQILEIEPKSENIYETASSDLPPIDIIFRSLFENYILNEEKPAIYFKKLFTLDEYFQRIKTIFIEEQHSLDENGKISETIFAKIDELIDIELNKSNNSSN